MPFEPDKPTSRFQPDQPPKDTQQPSAVSEFLKKYSPGYLGPLGGFRMYSEGIHPSQLLDKAIYEAGGKVTDVTGSPEAGFATNVGLQIPLMMLGGNVGAKAAPVLEKGAEKLMYQALKPTLATHEKGAAEKAVKTMLDKGINVSEGGLAKLRGQIEEVNDIIKNYVASSNASIDKSAVIKFLDDVRERFLKQANPQGDLEAIAAVADNFANHPLLKSLGSIPVQLAQELKQGTYRLLREKYGQLGSATVEAEKGIARGLKEGVADAIPGINSANKLEGELINAADTLERRVLMSRNNNTLGISGISPTKEGFIASMIDRSPFLASILARTINAGSTVIPQTAGQVVSAGTPSTLQGIYERSRR